MESAEAEVRALLDRQAEAIGSKDIERLMAMFAPEVVYYDLGSPLQTLGAAALRGRFEAMFDRFSGAIGQDIHDLHIVANGDVAVAARLIRASGTFENGQDVSYWVRATSGCRRSSDGWLITHEHISLPADMASGRVLMDLVP